MKRKSPCQNSFVIILANYLFLITLTINHINQILNQKGLLNLDGRVDEKKEKWEKRKGGEKGEKEKRESGKKRKMV